MRVKCTHPMTLVPKNLRHFMKYRGFSGHVPVPVVIQTVPTPSNNEPLIIDSPLQIDSKTKIVIE